MTMPWSSATALLALLITIIVLAAWTYRCVQAYRRDRAAADSWTPTD